MELLHGRAQAVDVDNIERQIREIARRKSDARLVAELARILGRNVGQVRVSPSETAPSSDRNDQDVDDGFSQGPDESVELASHRAVDLKPDELEALAPPALSAPSRRRLRALGLAVPILVALGAGAAVAMRVALTYGVGSEPPAIKAEEPTPLEAQVAAADLQMPAQSEMGLAGSSLVPIDLVQTTTPAPSDTTVISPTPPARTVAANEPVPSAPQSEAINLMFGTPHRVNTVSIKPDLALASKGEPEVAPLPPTRPKTLVSTVTTTVKAGHTTLMAQHSRQRYRDSH